MKMSRSWRRYIKYILLIVISFSIIYWLGFLVHPRKSRPAPRVPVEDHGQFVKKWIPASNKNSSFQNKRESGLKQILYWTNFFGILAEEYVKQQNECNCPYQCQLTADRGQLESSDAILFHLYDTWAENWILNTMKVVPFPKYRNPSQVWVMVNMEPLGNLWGNFEIFNGLFNWTMTYRGDSTICLPYGHVQKLNSEKNHSKQTVNYYRQKSKTTAARISNCKDYARRYQLVKQIAKYLDVDLFGKCYNNLCGFNSEDPFDKRCFDIIKEYRFYLAFENSFCRDYVTEKYWLSLQREQVPIVNWKHVNSRLVIPNSYINVYDFPDIESFAHYIKLINSNETLYNGYFEWKHRYMHVSDCISCITCQALHENVGAAQVYTDFAGWIHNDFCEEANDINIWWKNFDWYMFDK